MRRVELERPQRAPGRRHAARLAHEARTGPLKGPDHGRVGLLREGADVAHAHLARRGTRHEQHGRSAPVALDLHRRGRVALHALHEKLLVAVAADLDPEAGGRVERHVDVGGRYGIGHPHGGLARGEGQGQEQPRDELRRERTVHRDRPAPHRPADLKGQAPAAVAHRDAQRAQRFEQRPHGACEQRALALDAHGLVPQRGDGGEEPRGQTRLARKEASAARAQSALDAERRARTHDAGAQRLDAAQGRERIVAEVDAVQLGAAFGQQGRGQRPLRIAFGTGGRQRAAQTPRRDGGIQNTWDIVRRINLSSRRRSSRRRHGASPA